MKLRFDVGEIASVPWKNGGGVTRLLAASGDQTQTHWRLSLAEIQKDGPFSTFPGWERILTIVDGDGIDLTGDGNTLRARPWVPLEFSGDIALHGTLPGRASQAFNLMYDGTSFSASVTALSPGEISCPDGTNILYCHHGSVSLAGEAELSDGQGQVFDTALSAAVRPGTGGLLVSLTQTGGS